MSNVKVKGVYYDNHMKRWMGRIQHNGVTYRKGFVNQADAIAFRRDIEARLNLIAGGNVFIMGADLARPENFCFKDSFFDMVYLPHIQHFAQRNVKTGEAKTDSFGVKGIHFRLIYKDNVTIVIFDNGIKGIAKCGKLDKFSRKTGLEYAFGRAFGQYLLDKYKE